MPDWTSDQELFDLIRKELYTSVVGDVLDNAGLIHQFLPPQIRPLTSHMRVVGRAMTVLEADCFSDRVTHSGKPFAFGLMFHALDDLKPGEVYICAGASPSYALWGELMSTRATYLKAVGAVVDGYVRDTNGILEMDFPTFAYGSYGQDQRVRGRVIDYRCPIEFGNGVAVNPGDIVFGDIDGVVVVPALKEEEIIQAALEKVRGENMVRKYIQEGMPTVEVWEKYGIM